MIKKWQGSTPTICDMCNTSLKAEKKFVDGKTRQGPWGLLCLNCHKAHGVGLGLGLGQLYELRGVEWIKTRG